MILPSKVSSGLKSCVVQNSLRSIPRKKQSAMLVKVLTMTERVSSSWLVRMRRARSIFVVEVPSFCAVKAAVFPRASLEALGAEATTFAFLGFTRDTLFIQHLDQPKGYSVLVISAVDLALNGEFKCFRFTHEIMNESGNRTDSISTGGLYPRVAIHHDKLAVRLPDMDRLALVHAAR